jgi:hypothetical protein
MAHREVVSCCTGADEHLERQMSRNDVFDSKGRREAGGGRRMEGVAGFNRRGRDLPRAGLVVNSLNQIIIRLK